MADYSRENSGSMFRNQKDGNEKRPDYKGSLNVGGTEYWISGWIREAGPNTKKPGEKFISLSIEPKEQRPAAQKAGAFDEDVAF